MKATKIRTITIVIRDDNDFDVHEGEDCVANRLCWDEMLGTIATATHPAIKRGNYMRGPDYIVDSMERWKRVVDGRSRCNA